MQENSSGETPENPRKGEQKTPDLGAMLCAAGWRFPGSSQLSGVEKMLGKPTLHLPEGIKTTSSPRKLPLPL